MPRLWIREPSGTTREQRLEPRDGPDRDLVIGRDADADIVLDDQAASRRHARLSPTPQGWMVADLGSSNRTFVNGEPVTQALLAPGDRIGVGDSELRLIGEVAQVAADLSKTQVLARLGGSPGPSGERAAAVLTSLYRLSSVLAAPDKDGRSLDGAVETLVEGLGADRAAVLLLEGTALLCRAAHSRGGHALRGLVISQAIFREVIQSREAVISRDTSDDSRFRERASVVGEEIRSVIAAPIRQGEKILGILYVDRLEKVGRPFQSEDLYGVAVAGEIVGAALAARDRVAGLVEEREALVKTLMDSHPIVGTSKAIQRLREFIRRAAPAASTVLILGETGSGKELVARAIHYQSGRRGGPFVAINCAAIPETLVESELFGHEKGAFTGAVERKLGKFEIGDRGTVFLDEIADLPLPCQSKLLRLLEERCFERVGGTRSVQVDVRIVAATNRDLAAEVEGKRFREDLYYRLNVLQVNVPPLRARPEDVPLLVDHFLDHYCAQAGVRRKSLSEKARSTLLRHPWPGNVRQLRNAIESCVVMSTGDVIEEEDLPIRLGPTATAGAAPAAWMPRSLDEVEREHIERVLQFVEWNKSKASEVLGMERSTLYARIKSYGLKREE